MLIEKSSPVGIAMDAYRNNFLATKESKNTRISFVWGVKGVNRNAIKDRWDPNDPGAVDWDSDFDMSSTVA